MSSAANPRVAQAAARSLAEDALKAVGVAADVAVETARALWLTSLRGVDSHGLRLLPHYVSAVEGGRLNPTPDFQFEQTTASTGRLDADHGLGHAAGMVAMRHAIELAKEAGVGLVSVRNSSHCGAMATYALEACQHEMLGLAFTHAAAKMRSAGATRPFFGANPICFAAPMADEEPYCFDSAPTPFSVNKVRQYAEEGRPLPPEVGADKDGRMTTDASLAEQVLPIGDYKGFGLSMMVEVLTSLLAGMPAGPEISSMFGDPLSARRNLAQFYGAIRIDAFEDVDTFKRRLQDMADKVRQEPRLDPEVPVQVAGDPEKRAQAERMQSGIPFSQTEFAALNQLAERLGLEPLQSL